MNPINKLGRYAEYFNFFVSNYLLWTIAFIVAIFFIIKYYKNSNPNQDIIERRVAIMIIIILIAMFGYFIYDTVHKVDDSHKPGNLYLIDR